MLAVHSGNLVPLSLSHRAPYLPESMMEARDEHVEELTWSAIRALKEQVESSSQMADEIDGAAEPEPLKIFADKSRVAFEKSAVLRRFGKEL